MQRGVDRIDAVLDRTMDELGNPDARAKVAQSIERSFQITRLLAPQYKVRTAADGEEALTSIRQQRPDLLLSDVMMPRLDGLGLVRQIRVSHILCGGKR